MCLLKKICFHIYVSRGPFRIGLSVLTLSASLSGSPFEWCCLISANILKIFNSQRNIWMNVINGLEQDCNNSSVLAMELLQSCTKPLMSYFITSYMPAAGLEPVSVKPSAGAVNKTASMYICMRPALLGIISSGKEMTGFALGVLPLNPKEGHILMPCIQDQTWGHLAANQHWFSTQHPGVRAAQQDRKQWWTVSLTGITDIHDCNFCHIVMKLSHS